MSIGPSELQPGSLDFIFVIRFNEGKNRLLTTGFDIEDNPGAIADNLIEMRFANAVRNHILALFHFPNRPTTMFRHTADLNLTHGSESTPVPHFSWTAT